MSEEYSLDGATIDIVASNMLRDCLYTFANELCNALEEGGHCNRITLNNTVNTVMKKFGNDEVRLKSAVTIRTKRSVTPKKDVHDVTANILSAVKSRNPSNWVWNEHPEDSDYQYTTTYKFTTGNYPLIKDGKLVGTCNDESVYELTNEEHNEAVELGIL